MVWVFFFSRADAEARTGRTLDDGSIPVDGGLPTRGSCAAAPARGLAAAADIPALGGNPGASDLVRLEAGPATPALVDHARLWR